MLYIGTTGELGRGSHGVLSQPLYRVAQSLPTGRTPLCGVAAQVAGCGAGGRVSFRGPNDGIGVSTANATNVLLTRDSSGTPGRARLATCCISARAGDWDVVARGYSVSVYRVVQTLPTGLTLYARCSAGRRGMALGDERAVHGRTVTTIPLSSVSITAARNGRRRRP